MNATMVASGTKAVPPVVSSIQEVPLAKIRESKTNPRRHRAASRAIARRNIGDAAPYYSTWGRFHTNALF